MEALPLENELDAGVLLFEKKVKGVRATDGSEGVNVANELLLKGFGGGAVSHFSEGVVEELCGLCVGP